VPWRIRLIDRERRVVVRLKRTRRGAILRARWIAFHTVTPRWPDVFVRMLRLAGVDALASTSGLALAANAGEIAWAPGARWTLIDLVLTKGSARKQDLIAAAIAKAARFH